MPDVSMPDGQVVRFPDNMPPEQIRGLIAQKYPQAVQGGQGGQPQPDASQPPADDQSGLQAALDAKASAYRQANGIAAPKGDPAGQLPQPNVPQQDPSVSPVTAAARGAVDAATFGFGDEAGAALDINPFAGDWGGQYASNLDRRRGALTAAQTSQPVATTLGELAGAVGTGFVAPEIAPLRALGVVGRVGEAATYGAAAGGLYGAGSADGSVADRARGAASGALFGGAAGGAGGVAVEGAAAAARKIGSSVGAAVRGIANPDAEAARRVAVAQQADNGINQPRLSPQDQAAAAARGQPVFNVDRGGEATSALARSAANTSPEARAALNNAIDPRFASQGDRTVDTVRQIVGNGTTLDAQNKLIADAATANRPAYAKAYADPNAQAVWDPSLEQLSTAPVVQDAIRQAAVTGRNQGALNGFAPIKNPFVVDKATGRLTLGTDAQGNPVTPTLQFWDHVKRNLDAVGTREATQASRVLRSHLDQLVPAYATARAGAAKFFGAGDALQAGDQFVSSRMANNEAAAALTKMSPAEKALFAEGFADALTRKVSEVSDRRNVIDSTFLRSKASQQRINLALGTQKAAELESFLRVEDLLDKARKAVQSNSTTARQLTELGLAGGIGAVVSGGNVFDPKFLLTTALVRGGRAAGRALDARVAQKVGEMLASTDPTIVKKGLQIVAKSTALTAALRSADIPVGVAASQQTVRATGSQPAAMAQ